VQRFPIKHAACIHRLGSLDLCGNGGVGWVCQLRPIAAKPPSTPAGSIIDEVKHRIPIWKKEHYRSGDSGLGQLRTLRSGAGSHLRAWGTITFTG